VNVEKLCELSERWGQRVIRGQSTYWTDRGRGFFLNLPPYGVIDLDEGEKARLLGQPGVWGLKYSTEPKGKGQPGAIYLLSDKSYHLSELGRRGRRSVRKGLRECRVEHISFDELKAKGMPANLDTLSRQKRRDPALSQPGRWASFCDAAAAVEGAGAWAAFYKDELAAYAITFITDDYGNVLQEMSRTDMMKTQANAALWYTINREMLAMPGINHVSAGPTSILDLPGIEQFKTQLGYEKRPVHFQVKLRPWMRSLLLNQAAWSALRLAQRVVPDVDLLKRAEGILGIARASR
jgi:hypothetical protein